MTHKVDFCNPEKITKIGKKKELLINEYYHNGDQEQKGLTTFTQIALENYLENML